MERITLLIPFLALSTFGSYYQHWDAAQRVRYEREARDPLCVYEHRDGHAEAERDLAAGRRRFFTLGETPAWHGEYTGLLYRVYRVETEPLGRGRVTPAVLRYLADYNAVMRRELIGTFGPDVLRDAEAMAERQHTLNLRVSRYAAAND